MNSRFWFVLFLLALWILLGSWLSRKYLCGTSDVVAAAPIEEPKDDCLFCWKVNDGTAFTTGNVLNNFRFRKSGFGLVPATTELQGAVDGISSYLIKNDGRAINITGYYDSLEVNNSVLGDLGMARANTIKKLFIAKGVDPGRINIFSKYGVGSHYINDTLNYGALLAFTGHSDTGNTRLEAIKSRLLGKPITLYFGTNQDNIRLSSQQRTDFTDLIYYLDNVSASKLDVSGHTDDSGSRTYNVRLSKERANFVRDYLVKNGGISTARMSTSGSGPDSPVASNSTSSGKAKNRRVEVTLN